MTTLRRDLLKVVGGAGVGLLASPVPWRLTGDSALWSQNWSWIPKLPRGGERAEKLTACTLCPAGCAVKARTVGPNPVALIAPQGALCPAGLCGHHVAYHPARLRTAMERGTVVRPEDVIASARKMADGRVAVLDLRPGRTASWLYRRHLASIPNGVYLTQASASSPTLDAVGTTAAFRLDQARTVIGISTPILESWGTPGKLARMREGRKIWQVDPRQSGSAIIADRWFGIKPHGEAAFLIGIMAALDGDSTRLNPASERCGISPDEITRAAHEIEKPAIAVADGDPVLGPASPEAVTAAAAFNARFGGVVRRQDVPVPADWKPLAEHKMLDEVPDHSLRLLFIDDSAPGALISWQRIESKLASDAVVVAASWTQLGLAREARYALPVASYLETLDDVATAPDAASTEFALSIPITAPVADRVPAVDLFARIAGSEVTLTQALEQRSAAIFGSKRGTIAKPGADPVEVKSLEKPEALWSALQEGARWSDPPDTAPVKPPAVELSFGPLPAGTPVVAYGWRGAETSPLLSKLWVESDLKPAAAVVSLHPETVRSLGLSGEGKARLETRCGSCEVKLLVDEAVAPGVMEMSAGQAYLRLCGTRTNLAAVDGVKVVRA